jgi:uncharacterized protein (DUF302 family)
MRRFAVFLLALVAACGRPPGDAEIEAARVKAADAAAKLMGALFTELQAALAQGPPEQAIAICAERAPAIARRLGEETGLSVRRTALKTRNPANAPDEYERAWLERAARGEAPAVDATEVVRRDGGYELRYMRVVRLAEMCTTCHGAPDRIPPAVKEAIAARYPQDRATGFATGDLRGAVSVRVPLDGLEESMLITRDSKKPLDRLAKDLEAACAAHKFGVLGVHDLKAKLKEKGQDLGKECRVYEVCNPVAAKRVLEANLEISTALPCRISLYDAGNGVTRLATLRPTMLLDLFRTPALKEVAKEVEDALVAILEDAAG